MKLGVDPGDAVTGRNAARFPPRPPFPHRSRPPVPAVLSDAFPGLRWKDWSFRPTSGPAQRRNELGLSFLLFGYMGFTFLSALLLYCITAAGHAGNTDAGVPAAFWVSTLFVLAGGWCLRRSVREIRRERQARVRRFTAAALLCGVLFATFQVWGSAELIRGYHAVKVPRVALEGGGSVLDVNAPAATPLTGVAVVLVAIHALHFLCGLGVLVYTTIQTFAGRYDHEYYGGLKLSARYWTFLDVIWLVMLAALWLTV